MDQPKVPKGQSANDNGTLDGTLENKILDAIRKKPAITVDQLAEETAIPRRTLMRYMSDMRYRLGNGKGKTCLYGSLPCRVSEGDGNRIIKFCFFCLSSLVMKYFCS
ncbi:MAG: winged helix-turn-helix domain-containing protein, partial [Lachnospiraceae bacterium]